MASRKQEKQEKDVALARIKHRTYALIIDRGFLFLRTASNGLFAYLSVVVSHHMVTSLANGKVDWNVVASAIFSGDISRWILGGIALGCAGAAYGQARLRRTVTAQHEGYIKQLEQRFDAKRSSSKLMPDGSTRKEDRE